MWIIIGVVAIVIIILGCMPLNRGMSREEAEFADKAYRLHMRGLDAKTSKKAEEILIDYELLYAETLKETKLKDIDIYEDDMNAIRENMETLLKEEWQEKASKILDKFEELYYMITDPDFTDVEKAYRSKSRCIKYWQDFFFSIPDDGIWRDPKGFMKKYLGEYYDDCMYYHDTLEKKLTKCIEEMKPEYKRKTQLKKDIVNFVAQHKGLMRIELFKHQFENATDKEVKYCYKELIEKYILVDVKLGNRYFVYLSDKEKARRDKSIKDK